MSGIDDAERSRSALDAWVRALQRMKQLDSSPHSTLLSVIWEQARTNGKRIALVNDNERMSYDGLVERSNLYASWALRQRLGSDDVICLLMPNCPDYVAIWLGVTQVGCTVALINTNLVGDALADSIFTAKSRHVILAASLAERLEAIVARLPEGIQLWVHGGRVRDLPQIDLDIMREAEPQTELLGSFKPNKADRALLIYTSGTTGLPKAANISHARVLEWSYWFAGMMDAQPEDRLYDCLPMYHSVGGIVAIGSMLSSGGSVWIRDRFSARAFWDDIVHGGCTIFQYIGELCRYLTDSPRHPREAEHRLRLCCGNGLRGDVWKRFQDRFQIPRVLEFYAATEGNVSLYNCEEKIGAIGRIPTFLTHRFSVPLIHIDIDTLKPRRNDDGLCIRCEVDEVGEAIGRVISKSAAASRQFDGYTDPEASARKVLRDVFTKGDCWFRTGDLMRKDKSGYYYFVDRIGDTFRWKGENIAASEVAAVIAASSGVSDAVVYGVTIPGKDGRAGMAAITTDRDFELAVLRRHLLANLPEYACPLFIRLCHAIPATGTFKLASGPLARMTLAEAVATNTVWFNDRKTASFIKCDSRVMELICNGTTHL